MLITPERFLKRANVDSARALAILVYKKLQVELDPQSETSDNYLKRTPNLFLLSFADTTTANKVYESVEKRHNAVLDELGMTGELFCILPPLFLLSNEKFLICYNDIVLVAESYGPVVPVVHLEKIRRGGDVLEQLITLYSKCSPNFVTIDTIRDVLT